MIDEPRRAWRLNRVGLRVSAASLLPAAFIGLALCAHYDLSGWTRALTVGFFCVQALAGWLAVRAAIVLTTFRLAVLGSINLIAATLVVLAIFGLLATGTLTIGSALAANTVAVLFQTIACVAMSRPAVRAGRGYDRTGHSRWVSSWAGQLADIAATRADVLIAGAVYATAAVGRYSVASILVVVCYQLSQTIVQRDLRALSARTDRLGAYLWSVRRLVGLNAIVAGLGVAVGAVLVPPVFGRQFRNAIDYLPGVAVLAIGLAVLAAGLFDLSRHNASVSLTLIHGLVPAICCASIVRLLSVPLTVMPALLGLLYVATGGLAIAGIRRNAGRQQRAGSDNPMLGAARSAIEERQ